MSHEIAPFWPPFRGLVLLRQLRVRLEEEVGQRDAVHMVEAPRPVLGKPRPLNV